MFFLFFQGGNSVEVLFNLKAAAAGFLQKQAWNDRDSWSGTAQSIRAEKG